MAVDADVSARTNTLADTARSGLATHGCTAALLLCARRRVSARTVLLINMAIVSGPTPPGDGVIAPATSATSGCTSPISADPFSRNFARRAGNFGKKVPR